MQYRPQNATPDGGCQTLSIVTSRWSHRRGSFYCRVHPIMLCIVNIMKVYIERNNLQLQLIRYSNKCLILRSDGFVLRTHSRKFRT